MSGESVLHKIASAVKLKLEKRKEILSFAELEKRVNGAREPLPFTDLFFEPGIHAISEVKFKSPALGVLEQSNEEAAVKIAKSYLQGGATALSILTEEDYFQGHPSYLRAVRAAVPDARLLMKDFVLEEYQILEARVNGADAILLIVSLLGAQRTQELHQFATKLGLSCLVEVHDESELNSAMVMGAPLIGINNRNLKTLEVSLEVSKTLIQGLSQDQKAKHAFVSESGIKTAAEMNTLHALGFSGFLIGSSLMTSGDPGTSLAKILSEAKGYTKVCAQQK